MPVKLLSPLRLFPPSLPLSRYLPMRFHSPAHPHRALPIFARILPFRLKCRCPGELGVRRFSTRPMRSRPGSEFSEVRASKSLIDDEAELSDWVSELKSNSFKDDSDWGSGRGRSREIDRGRDSGFNRDRNSDFGGSRRGESKPNSFRDYDRGGSRVRSRNMDRSRDSGFKRERDSDFGGSRWGELNPNSFRDSDRGGGRGYGRETGRGRDSGSKRLRDGDFGGSGRRTTGDFESFSRNSRRDRSDMKMMFESEEDEDEEDDDDDDDEIHSSQKKHDFGGVNSKRRAGKDSDSRQDRGSRGYKKNGGRSRRESLLFSDDGDDEIDNDDLGKGELMNSFKDLLSEDTDEDVLGEDLTNDSSLPGSSKPTAPRVSSPGESGSYLSESRFDQCSISPLSLKGIKDAGYEKMTIVQEATLPAILKGKDVLAKARTGTGKTVAFLLPSIEVVVKSPSAGHDQKRSPIIVLVICPTRELASQAAKEANMLLKYHPSIGVQVVIGGTRLAMEQKRMQANPCQILVATPGRLRDHVENTAGFATRLMGVKVLVLDEADHLLDMGFRKEIEKIIAAVPKQRQTLMFSATVPTEVRQICHVALKRDHEYINTVQEGTEETHSQVKQMHLVAPLDKQFSLLYAMLNEHISDDVDYKVLVFCTTAMVTRLVADLLGELKLNVREIHSRKPQGYRTRVSDEFRKSKGLILVTSDVSARGVDYPDVTLVIQVGLPADRQQYIHRLGRTGRKGKEGQGILLLAPWEEFFLSTIKDLPLTKAPVPSVDPDTKKRVERALCNVEMKNKEAAYQAWLGFYNSNKNVGRDKCRLVELANDFSRSMGLANPPAIPRLVLGKMGLKNVPGLRAK